jgi:hypothetical protein
MHTNPLIFDVSWLPLQPLRFCHSHTECKLIIVDPQRADKFEPVAAEILRNTATTGFLVFDSHDGKGLWKGMKCFRTVVNNYHGDLAKILKDDPSMVMEDNAAIMFTSGALYCFLPPFRFVI